MSGLLADPNSTIILGGALALICFGALVFALFGREIAGGARKRQRVQKLDDRAKAKGAKTGWSPFGQAEQSARDRLKMLADEQKRASKQQTLRAKLEQAGVKSSPAAFLMIFYLIAAAVGGAAYVFTGEAFVAAGAAVTVAFLFPRIVIGKMISSRLNKFLTTFPNAIDILVRGVKSGLPVSESMKVAANELPDPLGAEFRQVLAATNVGVPLEEALQQMADRVQSPDVNFFRTVLAIQKQSGGNLAEALSNLSGILRERRKMKLKVHAISAEARMSAIIIGSLPIVVSIIVYFMKPEYIGILFTHETGQLLLGGGAIWMLMGVMIMRSMVRFEI